LAILAVNDMLTVFTLLLTGFRTLILPMHRFVLQLFYIFAGAFCPLLKFCFVNSP